jgi:hypothetical protein
LLPAFVPARSTACSIVSVVNTPNATGTPDHVADRRERRTFAATDESREAHESEPRADSDHESPRGPRPGERHDPPFVFDYFSDGFFAAWGGTGRMRYCYFPPIQSDYISARLTMPQGTPVETTAAGVAELEAAASRLKQALDADHPELGRSMVVHVMATVGEMPSVGGDGPPGTVTNRSGATHLGEVSLELLSGDERPIDAESIAQRWRELTLPIPDVEELVFASALFSVGDPVDVELQAADVSVLTTAAERLKQRLAEYAGTRDISDSFREGKREIALSILPPAQTHGHTHYDDALQVRQAYYAAEAHPIQRVPDDNPVRVR